MLSSLGVTNSKNGLSEDLNGQCLQAPNSSNQMYELEALENILSPNPIAQEAIACSFHPSYGFLLGTSSPHHLDWYAKSILK